MRDLTLIGTQCERELEAIGIKCGWITQYTVNTRATGRKGLCSGSARSGYVIDIAEILLREDIPMNELRNTVFHELLHTCKGCMNHGDKWKSLARKVNQAYGLNISRVASKDEKSVQIMLDQREKSAKYRYVCENCGKEHVQQRASYFTRHPEAYSCGRCKTVGKWKRVV